MQTPDEMRTKIVVKAGGDAAFRASLLSDPKGVIESEPAITIPAAMSIEVHEESEATAHPVLPPDSKLSEADLRAVAAGALGDWKNYSIRDAEAWNPANW